MPVKANEMQYIMWQNHATDFYIASRQLILTENWHPACFCAFQAIETLLKATLQYWDKSFQPKDYGHNIPKLLRTIRNKVKNGSSILVPSYFYYELRYQERTRYPGKSGAGIGIFHGFLDTLDEIILSIIKLVPFQFNSKLNRVVRGANNPELTRYLILNNQKFAELKSFLLSWLSHRPIVDIFFNVDELKGQGFIGFIKVSELLKNGFSDIPEHPGIYVVLHEGMETPPVFLASNPASRYKGKDPSVTTEELATSWIEHTPLMYIGRAGGTAQNGRKYSTTLRNRIRQFIEFGRGKTYPHWGGRLVWQVANSQDFIIAFKSMDNENPVIVERELLQRFKIEHGKLPFGNYI